MKFISCSNAGGSAGGLRRDELVKMTVGDSEDKRSVLLAKEPKPKI